MPNQPRRLPEKTQNFIELVRTGPIEDLRAMVYSVVTGNAGAFDHNYARLLSEMMASSPHVRIFTELGRLYGLNRNRLVELFKSLPTPRQEEISAMVAKEIADELVANRINRDAPGTIPP